MKRFLFVLAIPGCATVAGPYQIAGDFANRIEDLKKWPLSVRCQAVKDAMRRCERAGLPSNCAWDGWRDADHDSWTISVCKQQIALEKP